MKNLVKFTAVAAVVFGASAVAGAQAPTAGTQTNNGNVVNGATITAHATVATAISATGVSNLEFGTIYRSGGAKTIAPSAAAAGVFTISGAPNATPQVAFTAPFGSDATAGTLKGFTSALNTLGVTLSYYAVSGTGACSTGATFTSGGTVTLDATGGAAKLCVGGVTDAPGSGQALDSYTGTVTMTVTF